MSELESKAQDVAKKYNVSIEEARKAIRYAMIETAIQLGKKQEAAQYYAEMVANA